MSNLSVRVLGSIHAIEAKAWNACHGASCPFLSWEFLALLEDCGAVGPEAVWAPAHAELSDEGRVIAYIPLYTLAGSEGSFVWDDGMEEVARALRLHWFPKLVAAVPFTPAPIWRPLVSPGEHEDSVIDACLGAVAELARSGLFSGAHLHWTDPLIGSAIGRHAAARLDGDAGNWISWRRQVYRWENQGYASFADFTGSFSKNMRRNVARDKADVVSAGIAVKVIRGDEADPGLWTRMADYYERTNDKFGPWAARFLPRSFFEMAAERIGPLVRFSAAYGTDSGYPVAMAMLFEGDDMIWGRYWGATRDLPGLHFETCYYAPIAYAIHEGISGFDPGMGSHHKARRGFRSLLAGSYHLVFDPRLRSVYADALSRASIEEAAFVDELNADLPFRHKE
ncbi:MAG: GNAT family N-acetyltransferase [Spirochaetia bacterium]|jgi:predicted N-acyltransferase|nr:GNAT family N-acetyltransferase [Spirochaetia bacterium]